MEDKIAQVINQIEDSEEFDPSDIQELEDFLDIILAESEDTYYKRLI